MKKKYILKNSFGVETVAFLTPKEAEKYISRSFLVKEAIKTAPIDAAIESKNTTKRKGTKDGDGN
jgi:hypothetical protein